MPLEIRASDVMQGAADALSNAAKGVGYIHQKSYDAQRVAQVNQGLTFLERAYQDYNNSLAQKQFDQPIDSVAGGKSTTKPLSFGETDEGTVIGDHGKFTQSAIDYITKNFSNPSAQTELLQHAAMKSVQNAKVVKEAWRQAAEHQYLASLDTLSQTVLQSNDPWERKVAQIKSRVDEGVRAGRLWPDEAQKYVGQITAQAQYSQAYNGAIGAMRAIGNSGAGDEWVDANTPYYNSNPDAREKVKQAARNEYSYQVRTDDEAADKEMWGRFDAAGGDPWKLLPQLIDSQNAYLRRMTSSTYGNWETRLRNAQNAGGRGAKEIDTPAPYLDQMRRVISDNWKYPTSEAKQTEIQRIGRISDKAGGFLVSTTDLSKYMGYAADEKFLDPFVTKQLDVIHANFEALAQKDKQNAGKYTQQESQVLSQFTVWLKQGERPEKDVIAKVSQLLAPTKDATFFNDQAGDLGGGASFDKRRRDVLTLPAGDPRGALTDAEQASGMQFDLARLKDQVGVGAPGGPQFVSAHNSDGTGKQSNGLPEFYVKGLDKKQPNAWATVRFGFDAQNRVQLQAQDNTGNWIAVPLKFRAQVEAETAAIAQATKAAQTKAQTAAEQKVFQASPFASLTAIQEQQFSDLLNVPNVTQAYVVRLAADLSKAWGVTVTPEQVAVEASKRGLKVK